MQPLAKPWSLQASPSALPRRRTKLLAVVNGYVPNNLASGRAPTGTANTSRPTLVKGLQGINVAAITSYARWATPALGSTTARRTLAGLIVYDGTGGNARVIATLSTARGASPFFDVRRSSSGGQVSLVNGTTALVTSAGTPMSAKGLYSYVATYDGSTSYLYINGVLIGTSGTALGGTDPTGVQMGDGSFNFSQVGRHPLLVYFGDWVDAAWVSRFHRDPWNTVFLPERTLPVPDVPAASGLNLTPGAGTVAVSGPVPTISLGTVLTPGKGDIALTGPAPSVALGSILTPGVGNISLNGHAPTVGVPTMLNPGSGTVALTGPAPTVTQSGNVAVFTGQGDLSFWRGKPHVRKPNPLLEGLRDELESLLNEAPAPIQAEVRRAQLSDESRSKIAETVIEVRKASLASERQEMLALRKTIDEVRAARRRWKRRQDQIRILLLE